jgi:hypothetical protein
MSETQERYQPGETKEQESETQERCQIPQILIDIVEWLMLFQIQIADAVEGEGRAGSLFDEGRIKRALMDSPYRDRIFDEPVRRFGDMTVLNYDGVIHVVNIKTSMGGTDNCFSKGGIVYALTDLEAGQIPCSMNFMRMNELINNHKADIPQKDYWYLCVNKRNTSEIMVRGLKQIRNYVVNINPSNILQIDWKKEKMCEPVGRTWDEAYETIIGGVKEALNRFWNNVPGEWRN